MDTSTNKETEGCGGGGARLQRRLRVEACHRDVHTACPLPQAASIQPRTKAGPVHIPRTRGHAEFLPGAPGAFLRGRRAGSLKQSRRRLYTTCPGRWIKLFESPVSGLLKGTNLEGGPASRSRSFPCVQAKAGAAGKGSSAHAKLGGPGPISRRACWAGGFVRPMAAEFQRRSLLGVLFLFGFGFASFWICGLDPKKRAVFKGLTKVLRNCFCATTKLGDWEEIHGLGLKHPHQDLVTSSFPPTIPLSLLRVSRHPQHLRGPRGSWGPPACQMTGRWGQEGRHTVILGLRASLRSAPGWSPGLQALVVTLAKSHALG